MNQSETVNLQPSPVPPNMPEGDRPQHLFLLGILCFAIVIRVVLILLKDVVGTDEIIYLALGYNVWHGEGFQLMGHSMTMSPPLLPLVAGFFSLFTETLEVGTSFIYVVFGSALVLPAFFLAQRIYGLRVARMTAFILAFYPGLMLAFYWGSMTEYLYAFVLMSGFLFLHKGLYETRPSAFVGAGFFLALAYLGRSEGILFFPVLFLFSIYFFARRKCLFEKKTLVNLLLFGLVFVIVSAPYPLFLKKESGKLSFSGKTKMILLVGAMDVKTREGYAGRLGEDGDEFFDYSDLVKDKTVLGMIAENPAVLMGGSLLQLKNFAVTLLSWKVFPAFLMGFVLIGVFRDPWDRIRLGHELFLFVCCIPFMVFLTFLIWPRYLIPMTPILVLWAARGVVAIEDWIVQTASFFRQSNEPLPRWIRLIPAVAVTIPLLAILAGKPIKAKMLHQYPVEYKEAGKWMNANLPADAMILTRKPEVAYYARRLMHPLPNEDTPTIIHYAGIHDIDYMVVAEFTIASRPQLEYLLVDETFPDDLSLIYDGKAPNGRKIRVFQIINQDSDTQPLPDGNLD